MAFQYENPPTAAFKFGPTRLDSQFQASNSLSGSDRWDSSSFSNYTHDNTGFPTAPLERVPYMPKHIDINYIDGSTDQKWSSRGFSWTKKLEVYIRYNISLQFLLTGGPINFLICLTTRPRTKKCLAIIPSAQINERWLMLQWVDTTFSFWCQLEGGKVWRIRLNNIFSFYPVSDKISLSYKIIYTHIISFWLELTINNMEKVVIIADYSCSIWRLI